ncbi:MAG: hypothetical protein RMK74_03400 [Myxococcales bacterium]|nr:hypothetical protein [Myxococcales bacterium]
MLRRYARWLLGSVLVVAAACKTGGDDRPMLRDGGFADVPAADGSTDTLPPDALVEPCRPERMGATLGQACDASGECDDGCFCNGAELCTGGVCVAGRAACDDGVECTADACVEEADRCVHDPRNEQCADEDRCNGDEVCDPAAGGCRPGSVPYCNDENGCTIDSCDPAEGCRFEPRDLDGDGFVDGRCGGEDCDDDPRYGRGVYPGAVEQCGNRRDDDCDGMRDYFDTDCRPRNDRCDSAEMLPGPGTYSGSTSGLASDYALSCRPSGADAVFRFRLDSPRDVRIHVSGGGTGVAVALRPFAACAGGPDEKCSAANPPSILRRSLPAGDWAIIVKSMTGGAFDLRLMFSDPTPVPPVDVCNEATLDVSGGGRFTGMFEEVEDDYALMCHPGSGYRDAAFRLQLDSTRDVVLTARHTPPSDRTWENTTYLSLVTDCRSPASTLVCRTGATAEIRRRGLAPGIYYVLLEPQNTAAVDWTLEVSVTDPAMRAPADACSSALPLPTDGTAVSASLATAELDGGTSCGGAPPTQRDLYFYFDLTETRDVEVRVNGAGSHYLEVQRTCGSSAPESVVRCRLGTSPHVQTFRSLPPGRYYVVVATTLAAGSVMVQATTSPPTPVPPNDRCTGAIDISGASVFRMRDTLVDFEDDVATGCAGSGRADAFYVVDVPAGRMHNLTVTVNRMSGTGNVSIALRDGCPGTMNLDCQMGATMATVSRDLSPGRYYVVVEMPLSGAGEYSLRSFLTPL